MFIHPQERSDEEAEAKPTESEVVGLAEFNIQLYTPKIEFVYSLRLPFLGSLFCILSTNSSTIFLAFRASPQMHCLHEVSLFFGEHLYQMVQRSKQDLLASPYH